MVLGEPEMHVIKEATKQGKNIIGLTVYVQESCILKAARAFLVFKALEDLGEIIVSSPSAQDIEDEKFDYDFSIIMVTESDLKQVIAAAAGVSEIQEVCANVVDVKIEEVAEETVEEVVEEVNTTEQVAAAATPVENKKKEIKPAEKKGKPVVNRTVRVDIEKLDVLMNLVSELIIAKNSLVSATHAEGAVNTGVNEHIEYLESVTTNLHESVMKVCGNTFQIFNVFIYTCINGSFCMSSGY